MAGELRTECELNNRINAEDAKAQRSQRQMPAEISTQMLLYKSTIIEIATIKRSLRVLRGSWCPLR